MSVRRLIRAGFLVLGTGVILFAVFWLAPREAGPFQWDDRIVVEFGLSDGQVATWGMPLPRNSTSSAITLEVVDPLEVTGLDIVGVAADYPSDSGLVNAYGFPPDGVETFPVDGAVLPPAGAQPDVLHIVIGIRLQPGVERGTISGVRVRYHSDQGRFETTMLWDLIINRNP